MIDLTFREHSTHIDCGLRSQTPDNKVAKLMKLLHKSGYRSATGGGGDGGLIWLAMQGDCK